MKWAARKIIYAFRDKHSSKARPCLHCRCLQATEKRIVELKFEVAIYAQQFQSGKKNQNRISLCIFAEAGIHFAIIPGPSPEGDGNEDMGGHL